MTMITLHAPYHPTLIHSSSSFQETNHQSRKSSITTTPSSLVVKLINSSTSNRRLLLSTCIITSIVSPPIFFLFSDASLSLTTTTSSDATAKFYELPDSGGVKALDLRLGNGFTPVDGNQHTWDSDRVLVDQVEGVSLEALDLLSLLLCGNHASKVSIHYYGRLAAKQGWRFDSTYDHKDSTGEPIPFIFNLGSNKVISGIEAAVRSMRVGGVRRVIIPPSQGYQNTTQEPLPPNIFDRQRLFTTIFNPTRLANGEGSTLGTLIFDIELVSVKH